MSSRDPPQPSDRQAHPRRAVIYRISHYCLLLATALYALPVVAFGIAANHRFGVMWVSSTPGQVPRHYFALLVFTECVWLLIVHHYKLASLTNLFQEYTGIRTVARACLILCLSQSLLLVAIKEIVVSREFLLLLDALLFALAIGVRTFFRVTSESKVWTRSTSKILVVGTDVYSQRSVAALRSIPFLRCDVQAYLQLPGQEIAVGDAPVVSVEEISRLEDLHWEEIIVAIPSEGYLQISAILDRLQNFGKPMRAVLDLGPRLSVREKLFQIGALQVMNLGISPVESFAYTVLKRMFDVVVAALALAVLWPVMLVIALLIKLDGPGPILFRQTRVGRNGKLFQLLKFRTMRCGTRSEADVVWTVKNDPRCTRLGAILRRFSLDELLQLVNVIRGEMSLVGPRPERPFFVKKFRTDMQKYNLRHSCQVGMTGWAQVNGLRGDTSIPDRLQADLHYITNWSFGLDLQILARTMVIALKDQNGY